MKVLRIGDPHIRPNNIEEADKLMHFVVDKILELKPDRVEILGDLFHTHAVLRLEVLEFWDAWLETLSEAVEVVILVGNHDQSGDFNSHSNALSVFKRIKSRNLKIVELPRLEGIYGYMPYYHNREVFVELANGLVSSGAKVLICHQTFDGSQYENGFYAPDGIDPARINCDTIISGHIHKRQVIKANGKTVLYPGTAKWDTASDANEKKGIWLYTHDDSTGKIISEEFISTESVCTPFISITWKEGDPEIEIPKNSKVVIELVGSSEWISKKKNSLKGKASITTQITDKQKASDRKTGGSLEDFIKNYYASTMDKDSLLKYAKEIGIV